jgi:tRNA nucleotidyltransferase (CCA-adding enzyme)
MSPAALQLPRPKLADLLPAMPRACADLLRRAVAAANEHGIAVYLVGGPVRDWLLERSLRDVDLIVEPGAIDTEALARAAAPPEARIVAHDRFGTVTLSDGKGVIDLATSRRESYEHPGALPRVEPAPIGEDLGRRDFSVNALALPLSRVARSRHAGIVDPTGGLEDLDRRTLRVLHDRTFHDDPTRAFRADRLAPRLSFSVSRSSRSALRGALRDGAFGRVSGERLRRELTKLFDDASVGLDPARALRLLSDWHVLAVLEPGLSYDKEVVAPLRRVGRAVATPPWRAGRWRPWATGLAVWLAPLSPQLRRRTLRRFAVRGGLAERITAMPSVRDRALRALARARGRGAIDAALRELPEEELHALHAWAEPALRRRIARYAAEDRYQRLPINGSDLAALGLSGPALGRGLERVRVAFLDGAVHTRDEALALAAEIARRRSGSASPPR